MASDQTVHARLILQAQAELARLGTRRVYSLMEQTEPDLAEVVLEQTTALYHEVLQLGVTPKDARRVHQAAERLVLVCILALQKAHAALWQDGSGQDVTSPSHLPKLPPGTDTVPDTTVPDTTDHGGSPR